ncbi:MAG TPA: hypothetical protein PKD00_01660 [Burkholderiales bacterium]|nr:hypothetical protein [Burkholderiales bacterium]
MQNDITQEEAARERAATTSMKLADLESIYSIVVEVLRLLSAILDSKLIKLIFPKTYEKIAKIDDLIENLLKMLPTKTIAEYQSAKQYPLTPVEVYDQTQPNNA